MFSQFLILGVGLLGGSVGLAVKRCFPSATVIGVDRCPATLETAKRLGIVDRSLMKLDEIPFEKNEPMLAVVCTPVGAIRKNVHRLLNRYGDGRNLLVTDVGSTKASLCRDIDDLRFIGSHPIAGSQLSGPEAARHDLFQSRPTVLTPTLRHDRSEVDRLRRFWESLGSIVLEMDADRHDEILAATSHLPHLLSVALVSTVTDEQRSLTGAGYADMTRLAAGPPEVWRDILCDNGENVLSALRRFQNRLMEIATALETKDIEAVESFLRRGRNATET